MAKKVGSSSWLAELVKFIKNKLAADVTEINQKIETLTQNKADKTHTHTTYASKDHTHTSYAEKDHTHSEYIGMVREFDSGRLDSTKFTTEGNKSKFYSVTVGELVDNTGVYEFGKSWISQTVLVDYRAVEHNNLVLQPEDPETWMFVRYELQNGGYISAAKVENGTLSFILGGEYGNQKIINVCGYY